MGSYELGAVIVGAIFIIGWIGKWLYEFVQGTNAEIDEIERQFRAASARAHANHMAFMMELHRSARQAQLQGASIPPPGVAIPVNVIDVPRRLYLDSATDGFMYQVAPLKAPIKHDLKKPWRTEP